MAKDRSHYTFDERLTCFTWFVHGQTLEEIARNRPPSLETLKRWSREENWSARRSAIEDKAIEKVEDELAQKRADFARKAWDAVDKLMDRLLDPDRIEKAQINHLTTAIGTLIDKADMVRGRSGEDEGGKKRVTLEELVGGGAGESG